MNCRNLIHSRFDMPSNSIDKFGRRRKYDKILVKERTGIGFKLSETGQYDMQQKRLINVGRPLEESDSINLNYFEDKINEAKELTREALTESVSVVLGEAKLYFENRLKEVTKSTSESNIYGSATIEQVNSSNKILLGLLKENKEFLEGIITKTKQRINEESDKLINIEKKVENLKDEINRIYHFIREKIL